MITDHRAPTSIMTRSVSHLLTYNPDFKERIVHTAAPETYFLVTNVLRRTRLKEKRYRRECGLEQILL